MKSSLIVRVFLVALVIFSFIARSKTQYEEENRRARITFPHNQNYGQIPPPPQNGQLSMNGVIQQFTSSTAGFGQPFASSSAGFGQQLATSSAGFGQQFASTSAAFGQQFASSSAGFGQQFGSSSAGFGQQFGSSSAGFSQQFGSSSAGFGQQFGSSSAGFGQQFGSSSAGFGQQFGSSSAGVGQQFGSSSGGFGQQFGSSSAGFGQQFGSSSAGLAQQFGSTPGGFGQQFGPPRDRPSRGPNDSRFQPHRPQSNHFHNFAVVFNEIDRKSEPDSFNATAATDEINDDFHGRSIVAPGKYPHMAALGFRTSTQEIEFKCGGSLISDFFVLTAAHCCYLNGQTPSLVKIGDIKLKEREDDIIPQRRRVAEIFLYPYYNSSFQYNDIALIQLNRAVEYTPFVRPIRLWARDEIPYDKVFTMGYGSTSFAQAPTNILTELDLSVMPLTQCNATMPHDDSSPQGIVESQICAKDYEKNRDTCQGDSGGPLQLNLERRRRHRRMRYYLVGIISYGEFCRSEQPGVYTRVSSYIDWIASIVWPNYFENS